jgi:ATP-dependent DNA ligase
VPAFVGAGLAFVFDLLYLDGRNLMPLPLADRKARLATLLDRANHAIRYSDHQIGRGPAFRAFKRLSMPWSI